MNDEQKLKEYADLKKQIKLLENQVENLKTEVMEIVMDTGGQSLTSRFGTFVIKERKSYEYPQEIIQQELDLKAAKAVYEASREAVLHNVSCSLTFIQKTDE